MYIFSKWDDYENIINLFNNNSVQLWANAKSYNTKYAICYGQMTKAHKARGFHQNNRSMSIKVKEEICTLYAKGKIDNYEGKR